MTDRTLRHASRSFGRPTRAASLLLGAAALATTAAGQAFGQAAGRPAPDPSPAPPPAAPQRVEAKVAEDAAAAGRPDHGRSAENAVTSAQDAFGLTIGRESLGLYRATNVRGFSPLSAGNARLQGVYLDPIYAPNQRITSSTTIRVGIAAQGFPFLAPTGIVDYALRLPKDEPSASVLVGGSGWGSRSIEADASTPLAGRTLSGGIGLAAGHDEYGDGASDRYLNGAAILRWRPREGVELVPFWTGFRLRDAEASPIYVAAEGLPPVMPARRRFGGPHWIRLEQDAVLTGAILHARIGPGTELAAGGFHSSVTTDGFNSLRTNLTADGRFDQLAVANPTNVSSGDSGEVRLTQVLDGHSKVHATVRARERDRVYGGTAVANVGRFRIGEEVPAAIPAFTLGQTSRDRTRQWTGGIAYEGNWRNGSVVAGLLRTDYRKTISAPGVPIVRTRADATLASVAAAYRVAPAVAAYASFVQGLEDSPSAPTVAVNRGEPVPAIRTRQVDGGVRWTLRPGLVALAGAFELRKPYFTLDRAGLYRNLGQIRNAGLEFSFTGAITPRLNTVLGAVIQRPRVSGEAVAAGIVSGRPVGLARRVTTLDANWRLPTTADLSLNVSIGSSSSVPATASGLTSIPAQTSVGLGGRYRFTVEGKPVLLRVSVSNVTDLKGFDLVAPGAYVPISGPSATAYLTIDL